MTGPAASPALALRADAGVELGTGHVMRALALAAAVRASGGRVGLVARGVTGHLERRARAAVDDLVHLPGTTGEARDLETTTAAAVRWGARWVVLDGYGFSSGYVSALRSHGLRVLQVDDEAQGPGWSADLVLNQNLYAAAEPYRRHGFTGELLLGPRFALLRPEFREARAAATASAGAHASARRVLVSLGGSDPHGVTTAVLHAVAAMHPPPEAVRVVAGPLAALDPSALPAGAELIVAPDAMVPHFQWADLVIVGAGTTTLELLCLGVPFVVVVSSRNQALIAEALVAADLAETAGTAVDLAPAVLARQLSRLATDSDACARRAREGRALVDGLGAERVWTLLREAA